MIDLIMHEYGFGLDEMRRWTFGQLFFLLGQMAERYETQSRKGKSKSAVLTEEDVTGSPWEQG